ncbi:MAG TPA: sensor domain-containing diguanylate cyclase [Spirochaetota bacterium]|nr:sensor domain-containing diguanylate cyclase [Spirochaetota bacterium]HPJ37921.1 sensor domain-containing diguanylate cyclase [Spirochaetota bacterium]HPQ53408.1 sensor domain-containing diguanylate cyclase [Spirochaetota bacterium]
MNDNPCGNIKKLYANIGKLITSSLDLDAILEGIMEEIRIYFNAENWSLMRLDPNSGELFFVIVQGIDKKAVENIRLSPGEGIAGIVAKTGESIFVPDTSKDPRFSDRTDKISGFTTHSIIAVPMTFRGATYGVIELINRTTGNYFSEDEHLILQTIADFSAIAFANRGIYEEALLIANTDPLTGLYNRGKLDCFIRDQERIHELNRRARDNNNYYITVLVDIDDFKDVNDIFGHQTGDRVLKKIAELLNASTRRNDMIFRLGGDEFLVLLSANSQKQVKRIEKRIVMEMEKICRFQIEDDYVVSFSYGISSGTSEKLNDAIHQADINMYDYKKKQKVSY